MLGSVRPVGDLLREWRERRRLSQLELALEAEISTRHLSFVETGRSIPSREMVLHLAEELDVPLRERNTLLVAAGYAPVYRETPLEGDDMAAVRRALTATGDARLAALYDEVAAFPGVTRPEPHVPHGDGASRLMVTLRLKTS